MSSFPPGFSRGDVPTPALVVDLDVLERNIAAMASEAARWRVQLRPHVKSHKCLPIARRQVACGATGVSFAALDGGAGMGGGGIPGILRTSPLAGDAKLRKLAALLLRDCTISVVADYPAAVAELDA